MSSHDPTDEQITGGRPVGVLEVLLQAVENVIIGPNDQIAYMRVLEHAALVHVDRESVRHGLWKDYPAEDQATQVKFKIDRVIRTLEHAEGRNLSPEEENNVLEELVDIINYAIFAHRIVEGRLDA